MRQVPNLFYAQENGVWFHVCTRCGFTTSHGSGGPCPECTKVALLEEQTNAIKEQGIRAEREARAASVRREVQAFTTGESAGSPGDWTVWNLAMMGIVVFACAYPVASLFTNPKYQMLCGWLGVALVLLAGRVVKFFEISDNSKTSVLIISALGGVLTLGMLFA
jgi:hypothetical protein